jgi:hypothetical protein
MTADYRVTTLWTTAFGDAALNNPDQKIARDNLLAALRKLDERVAPLLAKIDESCRNLTIHDISHAHQLWSVASEICGPDYPMNPLEGFVLGAAFLIHDAGLTAAAYPGGLATLRKTNYYRDRIAALLRADSEQASAEETLKNPPDQIAERALFDTLRAIHATRAENLLEETKPHPLTGQPYPLFPDADLFVDCGEITGLIAASHHWNIETLDERFREPLSPPAAFPGWAIDGVKLACILRAADACAIDERRARIMPFLMLNPSEDSRDHWKFQAYLNPGARREEAIVFQSKRPFPRGDMFAWWVAYDAISVADRELRDCDRLLRDRTMSGHYPHLKPLGARRVEGAGEPNRLRDFIRVSGWTPVDTVVRIENPINLIEKLGGWQLYGNDFSAPIREVIQNSADAIRARRRRASGYDDTSEFPGRIDIYLDYDDPNDPSRNLTVTVADDGVGMSADLMTGALLDFGQSFWNSDAAAEKYPGLLSDPYFEPTGKFGIGFFAIFMIADDVKIVSRSWRSGLQDAKALHFRNGVRGRAEFRDYDVNEDGPLSPIESTRIIAKVKDHDWLQRLSRMWARAAYYDPNASSANTEDYVVRTLRQLTFALDVECYLSFGNKMPLKLNDTRIFTAPSHHFAHAFNETFGERPSISIIEPNAEMLIDEIRDSKDRVQARGLIRLSDPAQGRFHIGGFVNLAIRDSAITGISAANPGTASRNVGSRTVSRERLQAWGEEQLQRLSRSKIELRKQMRAMETLCAIGVDISERAIVISDDREISIEHIVKVLSDEATIFISLSDYVGDKSIILGPIYHEGFGVRDLTALRHNARIGMRGYSPGALYWTIVGPLDDPTNLNSAYASLLRALREADFQVNIEPPGRYALGVYVGPEGGHGDSLSRELTRNAEIKRYGFVIHADRTRPKARRRARYGISSR